MGNNKWTLNQKLVALGIFVAIIGNLINLGLYFITESKQIIITQDIDNLKSKTADIEKLRATAADIESLKAKIAEIEELTFTDTNINCPSGTAPAIGFGWTGIKKECI